MRKYDNICKDTQRYAPRYPKVQKCEEIDTVFMRRNRFRFNPRISMLRVHTTPSPVLPDPGRVLTPAQQHTAVQQLGTARFASTDNLRLANHRNRKRQRRMFSFASSETTAASTVSSVGCSLLSKPRPVLIAGRDPTPAGRRNIKNNDDAQLIRLTGFKVRSSPV